MKLGNSVIFFLIYGILNMIFVQASRDLQTSSIDSFGRLTVRSQCSDYVNRQTLFETYGIDNYPFYDSSVESTFNFDIEKIQRAVDQGWGQITNQAKSSAGKVFLYVGAWVIGLALTLLIWPFLLCCCCCPWSCPPCGRDLSNKPYTRVQILWPALVSLILLMVILITSIVGISSHHKAQKAFQELACIQGVIFDNFINGNKAFTDQTDYFLGIRSIDSALREMNNSIVTINSEIDKFRESDPMFQDIQSKIQKSMSSTAKVSSTSEESLVLSYNVPLASAPGSTTSTIKSLFPDVLGNKLAPSSLIAQAYSSLNDYYQISTQISRSAKSYRQNSTNFTTSIDQVLNNINATFYELGKQEKRSNDFWFQATKFLKNFTVGQYVFYGVLIGLSLLMIISIILMVFCMYSKCRYLTYGICSIFFVLCFLSYIVCIAVSLGNPVAYYSCRYLGQRFNSKAQLTLTLTDKLNLNVETAGNISDCIAMDGSKNFDLNFFGTDVSNSITSLDNTFSVLSQINSNLVDSINITHQKLLKSINDYKTARINDISDQQALDQLYKLSVSSQYPCSSNDFKSDSWIPSIYQVDRYVPCSLDSFDTVGIPVDSNSCNSTTDFTSRAMGCGGCMDTFDLFKNNQSLTDVFTVLTARYPDASCTSFNSELSNVWSNFYKPKIDIIGPVEQRAFTAKNDSDQVIQTTAFFTQVKENFLTNFSSIFDSQHGLLTSLNCQVAGQDLRLFKNVICRGIPSYAYFMRVVMGIISLCLSVLMCCVVCTGRRNVRQQEWVGIVNLEKKEDQSEKQKEKYPQQMSVPATYQHFTFNINGSLQAANNQSGQVNPYSQYACEP